MTEERQAPDVERPERPQPLELGWTGTPPGAKMPFGYPGKLYSTPGWCNSAMAIEAIFGRIVLCEDVPGHDGPHFSHQAEFGPGWEPFVEWTDTDIDVFRLKPRPPEPAPEASDTKREQGRSRPEADEADRTYKSGHVQDHTPTGRVYPFERTLLIKEPWVSMLLDGSKTWELRRTSTKVRGVVGLTPSGSGQIAGKAKLVKVHGPFTALALRGYVHKHRVDDEFLDTYAAGKPLYAWEFRDAHRFESPIPYDHPQGAVIWVKLPTRSTRRSSQRGTRPPDPAAFSSPYE